VSKDVLLHLFSLASSQNISMSVEYDASTHSVMVSVNIGRRRVDEDLLKEHTQDKIREESLLIPGRKESRTKMMTRGKLNSILKRHE
jgi:hypothetical protein